MTALPAEDLLLLGLQPGKTGILSAPCLMAHPEQQSWVLSPPLHPLSSEMAWGNGLLPFFVCWFGFVLFCEGVYPGQAKEKWKHRH